MSGAPFRLIQADDLTGAADTAVAFAGAGERTVVVPGLGDAIDARLDSVIAALEPECVAVDCASRDVEAAQAARRAASLARWSQRAGCGSIYKKVDSVLRGHPGAELRALLEALDGARSVVIAPAYPALGRTTIDARQLVDGRPLPGEDLPSLFGLDAAHARLVSLEELRGGFVLDGRPGFVIVDAEASEDLDLLAAAVERLEPSPLLVGSGGLAAPVAAHRQGGSSACRAYEPPSGRRLVVSVSRTAAATGQVERLRELMPQLVDARLDLSTLGCDERARRREVERAATLVAEGLEVGGDALLGVTGSAPAELDPSVVGRAIKGSLEQTLAAALVHERPELIVANGADSALAACTALGAEALVVERALPAGAVLSLTHGRPDPPLPLVTKSGGFGGPESLAALFGALQRARSAAR